MYSPGQDSNYVCLICLTLEIVSHSQRYLYLCETCQSLARYNLELHTHASIMYLSVGMPICLYQVGGVYNNSDSHLTLKHHHLRMMCPIGHRQGNWHHYHVTVSASFQHNVVLDSLPFTLSYNRRDQDERGRTVYHGRPEGNVCLSR